MKTSAFLLCLLLASSFLYGQDFPIGSWSIITDIKGNPIDIKNSGNGPRQVTSFDFKQGTKYSFLYEEYDSAGRKTIGVIENGVYSVNASQFILSPTTSTTTFYDYVAQSTRPISNSVKQNPLTAATYSWSYQKEGTGKLSIEPIRPGYREGLLAGTKAKATSVMPRRKELSAVRSTVRSL